MQAIMYIHTQLYFSSLFALKIFLQSDVSHKPGLVLAKLAPERVDLVRKLLLMGHQQLECFIYCIHGNQ